MFFFLNKSKFRQKSIGTYRDASPAPMPHASKMSHQTPVDNSEQCTCVLVSFCGIEQSGKNPEGYNQYRLKSQELPKTLSFFNSLHEMMSN